MPENKKFTQDELAKIVELRESNSQKISEFGQVELEILLTNQRLSALANAKAKLQEEYVGLQDKEKELVKELNDKYGSGTVDLESGEFIPTNWLFD